VKSEEKNVEWFCGSLDGQTERMRNAFEEVGEIVVVDIANEHYECVCVIVGVVVVVVDYDDVDVYDCFCCRQML